MEEIIISDEVAFEVKKNKIIADGAKNLRIVADFDMTLTKAFKEGKKVNTIIGQLRHGNYLTPDYPKKAYALFDKYHPIEIDPTYPLEEKKKIMHDWWNTHVNLIVKSGMTKKLLIKIVQEKNIEIREGTKEFLTQTNKKKIPLLILSGALGDFISEMLKEEKSLYSNTHIISNFFKFDKNGNATGYMGEIIHSLNKSEAEIKNTKHFSAIKNRKNVILLGDNIDDLQMAQGIEHDNILTIGFLNENINENLSHFKKAFDVVITNDGKMDFVNKFLEEIK